MTFRHGRGRYNEERRPRPVPRRTIPDRRRSPRKAGDMHNPEHDNDDEFGDGIDWGDEPEIDFAASQPRESRGVRGCQ